MFLDTLTSTDILICLFQWRLSSLKRHLERFHSQSLIEFNASDPYFGAKSRLASFVNKKGIVLNACANFAIKGCPFKSFDDPDLRTITGLALKGAGETSFGPITAEKVRHAVKDKAASMRKRLVDKLKSKTINISADFFSRNSMDFLGEFFSYEN